MCAPVQLLLWLIAGMSTLVAVLLAFLLFIDVDAYRGQIESHVSTAFGRDIVLEGSLSLEPSLTPRFVANGLRIANPDWASCPFRHQCVEKVLNLSLIHISEPTRRRDSSRMPSSA